MQTEKQDNFDKRDQNDFEEEIPEAKLSQQRQQEIFNDFKIAIRNVNFEKVEEFLCRELDFIYNKKIENKKQLNIRRIQIQQIESILNPAKLVLILQQ